MGCSGGRGSPVATGSFDRHGFAGLQSAIANAGSLGDQTAIVASAANHAHFTAEQVAQIAQTMSSLGNQIEAVELLAPRVIDPQKAYRIAQAMSSVGNQQRAMELL